jgi:hypothetical protein
LLPPPTKEDICAHYHARIAAALTTADAEQWNAQSLDSPRRAMQPVPAQYARDFATHPTVQAYLSHLVVDIAPDAAQAPAMCHSGQWSDNLCTNTCPTDCQLMGIHNMLCYSPALHAKIDHVARGNFAGHVAMQHPDADSRARATAIANAVIRCHDYFLAKKFSAGRLVVLDQMLQHNIVRYPAGLHQRIDMHGSIHMPTLLACMDKSVCCLAKHVTTQCSAGQACSGVGNKYLGEGQTQLKLSQLDTPGRQRSQSFVNDLNDLLVPTFKVLPCQMAARNAFEIARAGPVEIDEDELRPDECRQDAHITESVELDDYPLILSVGLGAARNDQTYYNAHDLAQVYTLRRGQHDITYRLINVAAYDFAMHFNAEIIVPTDGDGPSMMMHYDAIESQRVTPYDPNDLTAFTPVHALFLRV